MTRPAYQWAIWAVGLVIRAPSILWDRDLDWSHNAGLDVDDADGKPSDGLREGWARILEPGRLLHDCKNIPHEHAKRFPKMFFTLVSVIIDVLLATIILMVVL
jgi:hypothetical protein